MRIVVNGTARDEREGATVDDLVRAVHGEVKDRGVAVAHNGEVLPRRAWAGTSLDEGDKVEILVATQGG